MLDRVWWLLHWPTVTARIPAYLQCRREEHPLTDRTSIRPLPCDVESRPVDVSPGLLCYQVKEAVYRDVGKGRSLPEPPRKSHLFRAVAYRIPYSCDRMTTSVNDDDIFAFGNEPEEKACGVPPTASPAPP